MMGTHWKAICIPLLEELSLTDSSEGDSSSSWDEHRIRDCLSDGSLLENMLIAVGEDKELLQETSPRGKVSKLCAKIGLGEKVVVQEDPTQRGKKRSCKDVEDMAEDSRKNFLDVFVQDENSNEEVDWFGLFKCVQYIRSFLQSHNLLSRTLVPPPVIVQRSSPGKESKIVPVAPVQVIRNPSPSSLLSPTLTTPIASGPMSKLSQIHETQQMDEPLDHERRALVFSNKQTTSVTPGPNFGSRLKSRLPTTHMERAKDELIAKRLAASGLREEDVELSHVDLNDLFTNYLYVKKLNQMYEKEVQTRSQSLRTAQNQLHETWNELDEIRAERDDISIKLKNSMDELSKRETNDAKFFDEINSLKTQAARDKNTIQSLLKQNDELKNLVDDGRRSNDQLRSQNETSESNFQTATTRIQLLNQRMKVFENRKYLDLASIQKLHATRTSIQRIRMELNSVRSEIQHFGYGMMDISQFKYPTTQAVVIHEEKIDRSEEFEHLKEILVEKSHTIKQLNEQIIDMKGNIRVFCRIRPKISRKDTENNEFENAIIRSDREKLEIQEEGKCNTKVFEYDEIFGPRSSQENVFSEVSPLIRSCMNGYNVCIFAYGQTGSGKTYTMEGYHGNEGVIYRSVNELFRLLNETKNDYIVQERNDTRIDLYLSVLEVYNEKIQDLLQQNTNESKNFRIKLNEQNRVYVDGLTRVKVENPDQVKHYLRNVAAANRSTGVTNMNEHSSRSHAVVNVEIEKSICDDDDDERILIGCSRLVLIDLAGSERIKRSRVVGRALEEAKNINKSLSALGNVMAALQGKQKHIPFRDSTLTYLLSDCLGGSAKALMFCNISCELKDSRESVNTLQFASRVRSVELGAAKKGVNLSNKGNDVWKNKIARLKSDHEQEINAMKVQLAKYKKQQTTFNSRQKDSQSKVSSQENEIKRLQNALKNANNRCTTMQQSLASTRGKRSVTTTSTQSTMNKRQKKESSTEEKEREPVRRSKRLERKRKREDEEEETSRKKRKPHQTRSATVSGRTRNANEKTKRSAVANRKKMRSQSEHRSTTKVSRTRKTRTTRKAGTRRKRTLKEVNDGEDENVPAPKKRKIEPVVEEMDVDEESEDESKDTLTDLEALKAKIASRTLRRKKSIVQTVESVKNNVSNRSHDFVGISSAETKRKRLRNGRLSMQPPPKTVQSVMKQLYQNQNK